MGLQVYNTLGRTKQPFEPLTPGRAGLYVCGLTVYDYAHIGHARTYVAFEIIRRWLVNSGYKVTHVRNVTDVDDKIINRARELGVDPQAHADKWNQICNADLERLGVPPPDIQPKVSTHIAAILAITERLIERGMAYVTGPGNVYFDVSKKADYGKLSNRTPEELMAGARVEPMEDKRNPRDFALWKASKPGEPSWDSPWGKGRPGWHIECSAMSSKHLGDQIDIHGGGLDLIFPHHENEVAQSEGASGKVPFVKYWLHSGFLTVNGEKMSKSLKNFVTIQDVLKTHDPELFRFFYANTHYRSGIDYSESALQDAERGLERLRRLRDALGQKSQPASAVLNQAEVSKGLRQATRDLEAAFTVAMNDDFNTREAIAAMFDFATSANTQLAANPSDAARKEAREMLVKLGAILTILQPKPKTLDATVSPQASDEWIERKIEERNAARAKKDYARSDALRKELLQQGIEISDTRDRTTWRRVG